MAEFAERFEKLSGSIIREIFKLTAGGDIVSFGGGFPSPDSFPTREIADIASNILQENGAQVLQYGITEGYTPLRESIVRKMDKKGIKTTVDNTIIVSGAQQGLDLMCKAFLNKGDYMVVESPTFLGAVQTFNTYEPQILTVPMDEQGMEVDKLEELLQKYSPKLIYTIPNFQNPTGVTMTLERRKKLVELATKYKAIVIEDDPYGELRYKGESLPTLKSMDTEGVVVYLGSFSKIISPGLRVGWVVADSDIIRKLVIGKQSTDVHTPNISQQIIHRYIADGHLESHIKDIIADYGDKRNYMIEKIKAYFPEDVVISEADGGLFLWVTLPEACDTVKMMPTAVQNKVAYVPGTPFYPHGGGPNTMRLNFSNASKEQIDFGMHALGDAIKQYIDQNK